MKELKRNIAHILALCMMLTSIIPTYAAGITLPEWSIVLEETENAEILQPQPEIIPGIAEEAAPEIADEETAAGEIKKTFTADPEGFPAEAELKSADAAGPQDPVSYLLWNGQQLVPATCSEYTEITSAGPYSLEAGAWYVVKEEVEITSRITNNGTTTNPAHLILTDGCTFNVPAGICNRTHTEMQGGLPYTIVNDLVIYGQTNNSGILQIDQAAENDAGIGGGSQENGGTLTINGGKVNVTKKGLGAGIGGGTGGEGGTITINGGTVDATGGGDAAGIGGCKGEGGTITINGGTVTAIGGSGGSGIGGGNSRAGGTIKISGGKVIAIASGSNGGAGIGGGNGGACGTIEISGGEVTATGGSGGAGIGGGNYDSQSSGSAGGTIIIKGGTVDATGGGNAAGIGGGHSGSGEIIRISKGTIKATGGSGGAGIGGGNGGDGGIIEISGGTVTAMVGLDTSTGGAGIGGGNGGEGGTITISGGTVTALATASNGGAGIGGGNGKAGGTITISGGTVTAIATGSNAGIGNGGGYVGEEGTLSIESTPVILLAGQNRASAIKRLKADYINDHQKYPFALISNSTFNVEYKVEHYKQIEIRGKDYTKVIDDTETKQGIPGEETEAAAKKYGGYSNQDIVQKTIALDGSTVVEVKYDIDYYTITFDVNEHGVKPPEQYVLPNGKLKEPDKPTADRCVFVGWYTDQKCSAGKEYNFSTPVTGSFTLYAKWLIVVTLNAKEGSGGTESVNAEVGLAMPSITVPKRQEYLFGGYFTEEEGNGTRYYNADGTSARTWDLDEPKTLYAYWISTPSPKKQFIVSFDPRGGTAVPAQQIEDGSTVKAVSSAQTGYTLSGWYINGDYSGKAWNFAADKVTKDITLYAKWTPEKYTISWCDENGAVLTTSSADHGTLPVYPDEALFVKEGYVHTGWDPAVGIAEKAASYKATYERKLDGYHVVSFDPQGGSAVAAVIILDGHTLASAETPERTGYDFNGWKKPDGSAFEFGKEPVTADITLTASWTAKKYVITWSVNGIDSASFCAHGELPEYKGSTERAGFVFTGWDPAVRIAVGPAAYTAQYTEKKDAVVYTVEFDTDGAKEYIRAQRVASGSTAVRPATALSRDGYTFKGWYKADRKTPFDFDTEKITADTTIYAVWEVIPKAKYTIRWVDYNDSLLKSEQLEEGSLPDFGDTNPSRGGYIFTGWTPKIALVTGDAVYKATYEKKSSESGGGGGGTGGGTVSAPRQAGGTFSPNWYIDNVGVWRIRNKAGQTVVNAWVCDDVITANGKNVWYLLREDGAMVAAGLVQDRTGNFYSLETDHNGYFGMLRYRDGYYNCNGQQVYLTFNREHNGSFGAITNADGLEKLMAIYGITQYGIGNENSVYTAAF